MKPYCHMGEMCIGCSPQLIEGICPDSSAGKIVAELVGVLQESKEHNDQAAKELRSQRERIEQFICGLDCLGMAIADAGYTWTPAMRDAYESCFFNHKMKGNKMEQEFTWEGVQKARAAIAKATGGEG